MFEVARIAKTMLVTKLFGILDDHMGDGELVMPRDTRTGGVLESMILPALERGGYQHRKQVIIGTRLGGRSEKVDVLAWRVESEQLPISLKWQQTSGTAEQKVPFEVLCLAEAVHKSRGRFKKAHLVLEAVVGLCGNSMSVVRFASI